MLVLSRRIGERIAIGDEIVVTVLDVGRGRVRLGVEAPPEWTVLRVELRDHPRPAGREPLPAGAAGDEG